MNPLPLDQIISHVSNFGMNLDTLENKLTENKGLGLKLEMLQSSYRKGVEANTVGRNGGMQSISLSQTNQIGQGTNSVI